MKDKQKPLQEKTGSMTGDLQIISEKVRHIVSPLSAIRLYVDGMLENPCSKECKRRLSDINRIAGRCISIARELIDLTMPYFNSKSRK